MIGSVPTFDSVYITNPTGNTTGYSITNLMLNTYQHDNDFHELINPIINQGYRLFNTFFTSQNNANLTPQIGEYRIFWFAQPWTTAGLIPAGVNNSLIKITNVFPNPTSNVVNLKFASSSNNSKLYLIHSRGYLINEFDVSNLVDFTVNISFLSKGNYLFVLVSNGVYSESKTLIKQ